MSKRWVPRNESPGATRAATDPGRLITKFLPMIGGHIARRYRALSRRNCMFSADDLAQIAAIELMQLADKWESIVHDRELPTDPDVLDGLFWGYLKNVSYTAVHNLYEADDRIRSESMTYEYEGEEVERPEMYEQDSEGDLYPRTGVRNRPDGPWWRATFSEAMDYWARMPPKDKLWIALRYYDELSMEEAESLIGVSNKVLYQSEARWRAHVRNQFTEHHEEVPPRLARRWEPPQLLVEYVRMRHRMDIHEYLGIVTISFQVDPGYLTRILDVRKTNISNGGYQQISDEQARMIENMAHENLNAPEIARRAGVGSSTVYRRLTGVL